MLLLRLWWLGGGGGLLGAVAFGWARVGLL